MAAIQHSKIPGPSGSQADRNPVKAQSAKADVEPAGDFEAVFTAYWPRIHAVLNRLTRDPDEAEDLALEVFLKFYQAFDTLREADNPGGWLYRTAMNLGLNALRGRYRRTWYEVLAGKAYLAKKATVNPEALSEAAEERRQVQRVLAEMSRRSAQLLVLRSSGFSYQELAESLQIGLSSVGSLLSRAEKEFEKKYHNLYGK